MVFISCECLSVVADRRLYERVIAFWIRYMITTLRGKWENITHIYS